MPSFTIIKISNRFYKVETTIPAAFEAVAAQSNDLGAAVRKKCREKFKAYRLMHRLVQDIDQVLQFRTPVEDLEPVSLLWDDQIEWVKGGKNWAEDQP